MYNAPPPSQHHRRGPSSSSVASDALGTMDMLTSRSNRSHHSTDANHAAAEDPHWVSRVFAWGSSASGQCLEDKHGLLCISRPVWVKGLEVGPKRLPSSAKRLACGRTVSMALTENGEVVSWGTGPALGR